MQRRGNAARRAPARRFGLAVLAAACLGATGCLPVGMPLVIPVPVPIQTPEDPSHGTPEAPLRQCVDTVQGAPGSFADGLSRRIGDADGEQSPVADITLSPGDRIALSVQNGAGFSGSYEIAPDGTLSLPYLQPLRLSGVSIAAARHRIASALEDAHIFRRDGAFVGLTVERWNPVTVAVAGAVYTPGRITVGRHQSDSADGFDGGGRSLSAALRSANGARPDADLGRVTLIRGGVVRTIDLRGVVDGTASDEVTLSAGDRVSIPSKGCIDPFLARSSPVTPATIKIFVSNLTTPQSAVSAAVQQAASIPYGSRLVHGLVAGACAGGNGVTNAGRRALLVSRNLQTGALTSKEVDVESILRQARSDDSNPVLLPGDAIACYESGLSTVRDVFRTVADGLYPETILKSLIGW